MALSSCPTAAAAQLSQREDSAGRYSGRRRDMADAGRLSLGDLMARLYDPEMELSAHKA